MRLTVLVLVLTAGAGPVLAHGPGAVPPEAFWHSWSVDPLVVGLLIASSWAYGRGVGRLWARAGRWRGIGRLHVLSFMLGQAIVIIALVSPLDRLGGTLLSAHMMQHGLLVTAAPLLLLLGKPGVAFAWALPAGWSRGDLASVAWRPLARTGQWFSHPLPAATLHGLALWIWHAPALFDAAVEREWLHTLEHASFFGTALLFWRVILGARSGTRAGAALAAAFATLIHGAFLGALLTLAPRPLYGWYGGRVEPWGLTVLDDQQLAGLLMWVPMGVVYFGACLWLASRLIVPTEGRPHQAALAEAVPIGDGRP
ncbi:cytochrome c oxidase assembly protein [Microvirga sp. M2]|uniref:cytochrome c oxidase assembly protein n=1 Tax=Microvirga sp. M2 TaxID=3073270 RepID=UPI0039C25ABF